MTDQIAHVITGLDVGGAELVVSRLAGRPGQQFRHSVLSLTSCGPVGAKLLEDGVPVTALGMRKNATAVSGMFKLTGALRRSRPSLVQTWLYHADLAGGLAARRAGIPVVWNLRQTDVAPGAHKVNTQIVIRLCALLSKRIPAVIVCGSYAAKAVHVKMGFESRNMVVIRNGIDTGLFTPNPASRQDVRRELDVADGSLLVGRVGRFHPQKGYKEFVDMAEEVAGSFGNAVFVAAGRGVDWENRDLAGCIRRAGLEGRFHLLGERSDVPRIVSALDVLVSSSVFGEGFPNVVAEGMSCAVPCAVTDVGDSAEMVADPERIVAPGDYKGLARAVSMLLSMDPERRAGIGMRDRSRVMECFDIGLMMREYDELYSGLIGAGARSWQRGGSA